MSRHARSDRSTSGAKAPRHARREDRLSPGPTRWRPPQACAAPGPPVGDQALPLQLWAQYAGDIRRSPAYQIRPSGDGTESLAEEFSCFFADFFQFSNLPKEIIYPPQPAQCKRSQRVGPGDRHSAALSAGRKTRMGQQGGWHKGMPGQGCHVMTAPKGRRAERRHRATRGARTAWHRAPLVGDTPGLCSIGPHP